MCIRDSLDNGELVRATKVEPIINQILSNHRNNKRWIATTAEVKASLGLHR